MAPRRPTPSEAAETFYSTVNSQSGTCITSYEHSLKKVSIRCDKGHIFKITPNRVISGKSWCIKCCNHCPEQAAEKLLKRIKDKEGELLSPYVNIYTKVSIRCKEGHIFEVPPNNIRIGTWCAKCSNKCPEQAKEKFMYILRRNGGDLLSDYKTGHKKLTIRCAAGHQFETLASNVRGGSWCKECHLNR